MAFVLGAIFIFSAESIQRSVLTTSVDARLWDWCPSPDGLGVDRVTRPRRPRHKRSSCARRRSPLLTREPTRRPSTMERIELR